MVIYNCYNHFVDKYFSRRLHNNYLENVFVFKFDHMCLKWHISHPISYSENTVLLYFCRRYGANEIFFIILKRINTIQLPPHYIVFIKNPKSILQFWTIFWKYACIFVEFNSNVRVCYLTRISWVFRKQMHIDSIENHYKYPTKLEIPKYVQTWKNRVSYDTDWDSVERNFGKSIVFTAILSTDR